jgi:hypothetical protein
MHSVDGGLQETVQPRFMRLASVVPEAGRIFGFQAARRQTIRGGEQSLGHSTY